MPAELWPARRGWVGAEAPRSRPAPAAAASAPKLAEQPGDRTLDVGRARADHRLGAGEVADAVERVRGADAVEQQRHQVLDRAGLVEARGQLVERFRGRLGLGGQPVEALRQRQRRHQRRLGLLRPSCRARSAPAGRPSRTAQVLELARDVAGALRQRVHQRRALVGELAEIGDAAAAAGAGTSGTAGTSGRCRPRATALATDVVFAWTTKSASWRLALRQRRQHGIRVGGQPRQHLVLVRQDLQDLVGLPERRVGPVDHRVQVRAARRQARAELVEDQREPLADRLLGDVLDDVRVDRRARVAPPAAGTSPCPAPLVIFCSGGDDRGCRARSRRTSRRSATAAGSRNGRWRRTG